MDANFWNAERYVVVWVKIKKVASDYIKLMTHLHGIWSHSLFLLPSLCSCPLTFWSLSGQGLGLCLCLISLSSSLLFLPFHSTHSFQATWCHRRGYIETQVLDFLRLFMFGCWRRRHTIVKINHFGTFLLRNHVTLVDLHDCTEKCYAVKIFLNFCRVLGKNESWMNVPM